MLAMVVNDDAGCLMPRGVWSTIASMLAPTGSVSCLINVYTGMSPSVPFMCALLVSTPPKVTFLRLIRAATPF